MSFENVIAFWRKVQDDAALQQKLADHSDAERRKAAAQLAQEAGFEVTIEEVEGVDRVVAFWQQASEDQDLQAKLEAAHARETPQQALDEISAVAKEAGYELQRAALSTVTAALVEGHGAVSEGEISEAELAGVTGGAAASGYAGAYDVATNKKWADIIRGGPGQVGAKP